MPIFGRRRGSSHASSSRGLYRPTYRYRIDSRAVLLQKFELVAAGQGLQVEGDQQRLACVLEEAALEGWKLIGISEGDFVFRRRI